MTNDKRGPNEIPTEPADRISAAFQELKDDTKMIRPTPLAETSARPAWMLPGLLAGAAAVLLVVGIVAFAGGDGTTVDTPPVTEGPSSSAVPGATEATVPGSSVATTAPTSTSQQVEPGDVLTVEADGYFPWLFPTPSLSWYEEGCPEPESVIRDFLANVGGVADPGVDITSLSSSFGAGQRRWQVALPDGEGGSSGSIIITTARVDPGVVDCDAWAVLEVQSPEHVTIDSPVLGDQVGDTVVVSGVGQGFEGLVELELIDERYEVAGVGPGVAGSELSPYEGQATLDRTPIDANLMVIARSSVTVDAVAPFAAVKVRHQPGPEPTTTSLAPGAPIGPVAVIGVAFDDVLNARSGAGVGNDILGEISPFEIGITQYQGEQIVGGAGWVQVGNPQSRDFDAWVNSSFLVPISGKVDQPDALYNAATDVREALSLNQPALRLGDVLAGAGGDAVVVSADAFFNGDEQVLSSADFGAAGGAGDVARAWGAEDGTGDPIEATVADFFDQIATSSALTSTERVAVNERIKFGNTIDNMAETFPAATIVELHFGGEPGEQQDFTWATVRLAFEPAGDGYRLVALALDNWTV